MRGRGVTPHRCGLRPVDNGLWDLAHARADAGVSRTGAEWCGVVDALVGVRLAVVPLVL
jgi:hypothetical protein